MRDTLRFCAGYQGRQPGRYFACILKLRAHLSPGQNWDLWGVAGYRGVIGDRGGPGEFRSTASFQSPEHRFVISPREDAIPRTLKSWGHCVIGTVAQHLPCIRSDELLVAELLRISRKRRRCAVMRKLKIALVVGCRFFAKFM